VGIKGSIAGRGARWGVAGALAALAVAAVGVSPSAVAAVYLAAVTPELVRVDVRENRLPNRLTVPGIGVGLVAWLEQSAVDGRVAVAPLVAAGCYAGMLLLLCLLGGVGMGDVKLAAALGLASWLPFVGLLSPVLAFLAGGVVSAVLLARRGRGGRIAFGPYLLAGYWGAVTLVAIARVMT
jgi:leader peptidase (prepilin peptidase)/N-methyltransferase